MPRPNKGPYLAVNQHGVYEIRYTENGRSKRQSAGTKDSRTAQKALAKFLDEQDAPKKAKAPTVDEALTIYHKQHVAGQNTVGTSDRADVISANLKRGLGKYPVDALNDKVISRYAEGRYRGEYNPRGKHVAPGTVRRELAQLVAAINYLVKSGRLSADSAPWIQLPKAGSAREFFLSEMETDKLLQFCLSDEDKHGRMSRAARFTVLALASAARKRSVETLTWDQVDLQQNQFRFTPSGTSKRRVPVPIPDWALPIIDRMKRERGSQYVLDTDQNIRPGFEWLMRRAAKALENDRYLNLTRHGLRHTAATQMARAGANLFELAGILGDSLATVEKNYLHHCPDHLRSAANKVKRQVNITVEETE